MYDMKDAIINEVLSTARRRRRKPASEFVRAPSGSKEPILAEMEYQAWFGESCEECLNPPGDF